jgi:hypothetical protein
MAACGTMFGQPCCQTRPPRPKPRWTCPTDAHASLRPSLKRAALEVYVRKEVRPRVVAICQGGLEGAQHQTICMAIAESLGKYQPIAGYGMVSPFCEKVCWHS